MGGRLSVTRSYSPSVRHHVNRLVTQSNHRLDCDTHSRLKQHSAPSFPIIRYRRILMHLTTYPMACQLPHHFISERLTMLLDGITNVTDMFARYRSLNSKI